MSQWFESEYQEITHEQLVRYAGASGDFNPIHTVVPRAQEAGFSDVIAHGMYMMGLASTQLTKWFSQERIASYEVRFVAPTYPGEKIQVKCRVSDSQKDGDVTLNNEAGFIKLKGKVYFCE